MLMFLSYFGILRCDLEGVFLFLEGSPFLLLLPGLIHQSRSFVILEFFLGISV